MFGYIYLVIIFSFGLQWEVVYCLALAVGGTVAAADCLNEQTVWTHSSSSTDPPMPQPAALWPSPRNVLQQRLTILVVSIT